MTLPYITLPISSVETLSRRTCLRKKHEKKHLQRLLGSTPQLLPLRSPFQSVPSIRTPWRRTGSPGGAPMSATFFELMDCITVKWMAGDMAWSTCVAWPCRFDVQNHGHQKIKKHGTSKQLRIFGFTERFTLHFPRHLPTKAMNGGRFSVCTLVVPVSGSACRWQDGGAMRDGLEQWPLSLASVMWQCVKTLVPLVNIKIAGKWMFIPLKMVLIGIDPYPYVYLCFLTIIPWMMNINDHFNGKTDDKQ